MNRGYTQTDYVNSIDLADYKQLSLLFNDLKIIFNAPIEKAFQEFKMKKDPFW